MSSRALQKIWSWFALVLLALSVLGFLRMTGVSTRGEGSMLEPTGILSFEPSEVADLALPLQLALFAIVLLLTRLWTTQVGGSHWATRMPVFFFEPRDVNPGKPGGIWYQRIAFVAFLCIPLIATFLFMSSYLRATIYCSGSSGEPVSTGISGFGQFETARIYASPQCSGGFFRLGTKSGPQYYPWMTWVYAMSLLLLFGYFVRTVWGLLSGESASPTLVEAAR